MHYFALAWLLLIGVLLAPLTSGKALDEAAANHHPDLVIISRNIRHNSITQCEFFYFSRPTTTPPNLTPLPL